MVNENVSIIKVGGVLLVTVPANPDDDAVSQLQEGILGAMERYTAKALILDISPVEIVDSFFARTVAETVQMVSLMGGRTIIAGMRPSVAITTTQLGLMLGNAATALDVDCALNMIDHTPLPGVK